jgi:phospholipid transport system transporter-binding protein
MIRREGERMIVGGPATLASAGALLREGCAYIGEGVRLADLSEVGEIDSSALALLLAWLRESRRLGRELAFVNLPEGLSTIARLYGVDELLPAAQPHP